MSSAIVIAALYRFVRLDDFESLRQPLLKVLLDNEVRGTLLLAAEGINGTVAGTQAGIAIGNVASRNARPSSAGLNRL